jgi:hypothetical protein
MQSAHCIVFVTNIETPIIYRHFLRLQSETDSMLDTFLCVNESPPLYWASERHRADFRFTLGDARLLLPKRYSECAEKGGEILPGFPDLAYMPALLSSELAKFGYVWMLEYDVDYAGHWRQFFQQFMDNPADLLGTTLFPREQSNDWCHWDWFKPPESVGSDHCFRAFLPIVRFSRRMLDRYQEAMATGGWRGHTQAIYPTLASYSGFAIEDIGGWGPLTPLIRRGLNYNNAPTAPDLCPGTMVWNELKHILYFYEAPELFPKTGYLYHPVKTQLRMLTQVAKQLNTELTKVRDQLHEQEMQIAADVALRREYEKEIAGLRARSERHEAQIAAIFSSNSWRLTKPLRWINQLRPRARLST